MSWISLRDKASAAFQSAGLDAASGGVDDMTAILPHGSLLMEFAISPDGSGKPIPLLHYRAKTPWASGLTIRLMPDGILELSHQQGAQISKVELATGLVSRCEKITLIYTWDAPARRGLLSVEIPDTGVTVFEQITAPMPLTLRDVVRMSGSHDNCYATPRLEFMAFADHVMPHGPLPTLTAETWVPTPGGLVKASDLRQGDLIVAEDGKTAQLRWAGEVTVPARGRYAPVVARAPFYGALRDVAMSPDQRIQMIGSEVEYLFATDRVAVKVGDLPSHVIHRPAPQTHLQTYCQFILDRSVAMVINGLAVEDLDRSSLLQSKTLRDHSVLAGLPREVLPTGLRSDVPMLRGFETMTLCHLKAA